jgi:small subunit ribosomal protein S20
MKLKTGRHTSAQKAARQAETRMYRNRLLKKAARDDSKELVSATGAKDSSKATGLLKSASSKWDKAAKKGAIHWKTAARKKSRLAQRVQKLSAKA